MLAPHSTRTVPGRAALALLTGCLVALLVPIAVVRGSATQSMLEGVIYDQMGGVVPEVRLTLSGQGTTATATTDAEGRFGFPGVDAGRYLLEGRLPGFRLLRETLDLREPDDWNRLLILQLGEVRETIAVRAARSAPAAAAATPVRVRVGGNVRPPRKLVDVKPVYPDSMREAGREGVVTIEAVIARDGSVSAARITSAQVHPELAIAAHDAVRQWKFSPTLLNGAPVDVVMSVSVSFTLE